MKKFVLACENVAFCIEKNSDPFTSLDTFIRANCAHCINCTILSDSDVVDLITWVKSEDLSSGNLIYPTN